MPTAARLLRSLKAQGLSVVDVSIGSDSDQQTWRVEPPTQQAAAQPHIDVFDPDDPAHAMADVAGLSLAASRQDKTLLALCAVIVRERNIAAWNAMTTPQKVAAVFALADLWKTFREFIDDKV